MFGISELALLLIVVIVILGAKKLPDLARSAGKAARILKGEARAMKSEDAPTRDQSAPRIIEPAPGDVNSSRKATDPDSGTTQN
jgi:sec-independent protein translocase protein TatA